VSLPFVALEQALPSCLSTLTTLKINASLTKTSQLLPLIENLNCSLSTLRIKLPPNSKKEGFDGTFFRMVARHGETLVDLSWDRDNFPFTGFNSRYCIQKIAIAAPNLRKFSHTFGFHEFFSKLQIFDSVTTTWEDKLFEA
jgi:hypothetical protein